MIAQEFYALALCPAAVISVWVGQERAVTSMLGLDQFHIRIGQQLGARLRQHAYEGIVLGVDDQSGNGDLLGHPRGARASIVIICASKAAVARGDLIIKFAYSPQPLQILQLVA